MGAIFFGIVEIWKSHSLETSYISPKPRTIPVEAVDPDRNVPSVVSVSFHRMPCRLVAGLATFSYSILKLVPVDSNVTGAHTHALLGLGYDNNIYPINSHYMGGDIINLI